MLNRSFTFIVTLVLLASTAGSVAWAQPRVFSCDAAAIVRAHDAYRSGAPAALKPALDLLRRDAEHALARPLHSVMEKSQSPSSGTKHDYLSLARYYWPDTTKVDGLPYVSKDGVVNPEIYTITDAEYFAEMAENARTLALASFIFNDERYGERAAEVLRTWFLDTATAMNPNLEHAQMVKGMDDGRPAGTIETRNIGMVCDAAGLLGGTPQWSTTDQARLTNWFRQYLAWLRTSKRAIAASNFENNIAIWFAVQAGSVALFVDDQQTAREIFLKARAQAVDRQIESDGSQPKELARATSANYVLFNIEAFFRLAELAQHAGVDLWRYRSSDERSVKASLDWVLPFVRKEKEWTWKQIKHFDWGDAYYALLEQASCRFRDPQYAALAKRVGSEKQKANRVHLLFTTAIE